MSLLARAGRYLRAGQYLRAARLLRSTWLLGAVIFVLTWPISDTSLAPQPGLDNSFVAGLHMAAYQGLHFGTQLVATYGPLGFLRYPVLYYRWTIRLSLLYWGLVHLGLCLTLLWSVRRLLPTFVAWILVYLAVSVIAFAGADPILVIAFVWAVEYVRSDDDRVLRRWFPTLAGVVAGFAVLTKVNTGLTIGLLALLAMLLTPDRSWRKVADFVASFIVSFAVWWFAASQTFSNLGAFVSTARQVLSGWSTVMMLYVPGQEWQLTAAGLVVIVIAAMAMRAGEPASTRARYRLVLLWLVLAFSVFKEGFVRQESGHVSEFFAIALGAAFALSWRPFRDRTAWLLSIATIAACWFGVTATNPASLIHPGSSVTSFGNEVSLALSPRQIDETVSRDRQALVAGYGLAPTVYDLVRNQRVGIVPSEVAVAWAYQLHWVPLPVFELYYAYTSPLDNLNAQLLTSQNAPARLLRGLQGTIDNRDAVFDSPAAQRAMLCHYAELTVNGSWEVLGRTADRCGQARLLRVVHARWQQQVTVPAPSSRQDLVFVRIHGAGPAGFEALAAQFYRAQLRAIAPAIAGAPATEFRLVPGTASDGLLLSVPVKSDYSGPFALGQQIGAIGLDIHSGSTAPDLTYDFYEQPIAPNTPARA